MYFAVDQLTMIISCPVNTSWVAKNTYQTGMTVQVHRRASGLHMNTSTRRYNLHGLHSLEFHSIRVYQNKTTVCPHQVCAATQICFASLQKVNKTSRCSNANLYSTLQVTELWTLRGSSINTGITNATSRPKVIGDGLPKHRIQHSRTVCYILPSAQTHNMHMLSTQAQHQPRTGFSIMHSQFHPTTLQRLFHT